MDSGSLRRTQHVRSAWEKPRWRLETVVRSADVTGMAVAFDFQQVNVGLSERATLADLITTGG